MFFYNELKPLISKISSNSVDLTSIQLSHKKITDKNLLQISDALQLNTNVTEIWLTNNLITEVGSLTAVLERNDVVAEVYLGGNKIGDKGASCIAALIQKNTKITDMGIEENNITDAGAKMLADALFFNSTLQTLKLNGNDIDSFDTMILINEKLKKNREDARKKLLEEHPEYEMQKIKREKKKKKSRPRSDKETRNKRSDEGKSNGSENASKPAASDATDGDDGQGNIADQFLQQRRKSLESDSNNEGPTQKLSDKFKSGLKLRPKKNPLGTFC